MKKRAIIFGCGNNFIYSARVLLDMVEVVAIADNDSSKCGHQLFGYTVSSLEDVLRAEYDVVVVTPTFFEPIMKDLKARGVPEERLVTMDEVLPQRFETRVVEDCSELQLRVAVLLYGGLGDYIVSKVWLHYLHEKYDVSYSDIALYVHEKDVASVQSVYRDVIPEAQVRALDLQNPKLIPEEEYDAVFWLNMVPAVVAWNEVAVQKNGLLYDYMRRVIAFGTEHYKANLFASQRYYEVIQHLDKIRYIQFADLFDEFLISDEFPCEYSVDEGRVLSELGLAGKRYITLNTGLNAEYRKKKNGRAWDIRCWKRLAELIRVEYPEVMIVQLGLSADVEDIGADVNLCGRTDVDQLKVVLRHAFLHADYEGGLVHLRHVMHGGPSVVMYGPTSMERFHYAENIGIRSDACPVACEWKYKDWFATCHNEEHLYICMKSITPERVFEKVKEYLDGNVQG